MKNTPILAVLALILLAASCKKSNTETPVVSYLYNQDLYNRVTQQRIRGNGLTSNTVNVNYTYYLQIVQK